MALNILLTNDDGYDAPGIQTLYQGLVAAGYNVRIVAPRTNQSAQGSSLGGTAALAAPIAITEFSPGNVSVDGRPATSTLVGLDDPAFAGLFGGARPDLVISGTNRGENIGESENISGTVNAAVQALFGGVPAIAVSAGSFNGSYTGAFANAAAFTADLVARLDAARSPGAPLLPPGEGLSVNVPGNPALSGVAVTTVTDESSSSFPYAPSGPNTYAEGFVLNTTPSGSTLSEGAQFLANRVTVSPIDGNWGATEADRAALAGRLGAGLSASDLPAHGGLNVLLLNEDGANSAGITAAREALTGQGYTVTVLAPTTDQSGVGSALFLNPVTVTTYGPNNFGGNATPSSLVSLALDPAGLLRGMPRPDLVVSGVDAGDAVGIENANHSATLAAAVTALFNYQVPSIAVSAAGGGAADLATGAAFLTRLVANLQATAGADGRLLPAGLGLSVNVPAGAAVSRYAFTTIDAGTDADLTVTGNAGQARFATAGAVDGPDANSEGDAFNAGRITVSPIDGSFASPDLSAYQDLAAVLGLTFGVPGAGYTVRSAPGGNTIEVLLPAAVTAAQGTGGIDTETFGGVGALTLPGTIENAVLTGPGNNTVTGNALANRILAGGGADLVLGGQGADTLFGNQGADTLYGGQGNDRLYGGQDGDLLFGNLGDDVVQGDAGADRVFGNQGADLILGDAGADTLYGGQGADTLYGGQGNDLLSGDAGDDVLWGDRGDDVLVGGAGADRYAFGPNSGADVILGFNQAEGDRLALNGQTYTVGTAADGSGSALLMLSGGGSVELAGVSPGQVGAGFLA